MISKNEFKVLGLLLKTPSEQYNVNQIARILKISIGSAHKILKKFSGRDILRSIKIGNAIYYKINFENKAAQKLCELILIENKNETFAKNAIAKVYAQEIEKFEAKAIILFGSILIKKEKANDIDVLFLISKKDEVKKVNNFCLAVSKMKTKPIIPLIITKADFKNKLKEKNEVLLSVVKNGVVLIGEDELVNLLGDVYD